jgi:teichuronic acid biosynthesis glycosyltransferase TuaC
MRIAVVTRYFPSSAEPWQGRSAYQTLRVIARHADVEVFYPHAKYPSLLKPFHRGVEKLDEAWRPADVNASYYDFPTLPLISRPFNGWLASRAVLSSVRKFAPDVIFSCFLYPDGYAALRVGKALGGPVVAMSIGSDINRIEDAFTKMHTLTVLRESDFLVTVSSDLRSKAIAMGASAQKARTVINGCDLSVFRTRDKLQARSALQIDPGVQAVVFIGRIDVKKGLRELVEAAASLHAQRPALHVYLVGEGPDRPVVQSAIEARQASGYIHLLPACAFDDVAVWMAAADLVTLPSYMEGCPNAVLEALACGRPVVATNVGGIPEIMNEACGSLVPPRDPAALALAIDAVLSKSWDAAGISAQRGRSWETVGAELLEIFESLVPASKMAHHH